MTFRVFSDLEDLAGLTRLEGIDARPTLLRVLTDFYIQKPTHTREEETHFTELAIRLIEEVDVPTKIAVARRLADYGTPPDVVMRRLASDAHAVADAIAARSAVAHADQRAPSSGAGQRPMDRLADDLAAASRFSDMFFAADSTARRALLTRLDAEISGAPRAIAANDAASAIRALELAALNGRASEFTREIGRALAIPRLYAERIVNDVSGEPMLVAAKVLVMPIDVLQRILLLVNPAIGNSVRRVFDLSAFYQVLSLASARRMVLLWRHAAAPISESDQPAMRPSDVSGEHRDPRAAPRHAATPDNGVVRNRDQRAS